MSRTVFVTKRAQRDIERIDQAWVQLHPLATDLFFLELRDMFDLLKRQPLIGLRYPSRSGQVRRILLRASRYHVYYRVLAKQIVVVTVWSAVRGRTPKI